MFQDLQGGFQDQGTTFLPSVYLGPMFQKDVFRFLGLFTAVLSRIPAQVVACFAGVSACGFLRDGTTFVIKVQPIAMKYRQFHSWFCAR